MRKALVVAPSWIGDTILAQPLFARLHERHPGLVLDAFARLHVHRPASRLILVPHEPTESHLAPIEREAAPLGLPPAFSA